MDQTQFSQAKPSEASAALDCAKAPPLSRRILAPMMVGFGLCLTLAWIALLGYKLFSLLI
jgi:hypothetical protein